MTMHSLDLRTQLEFLGLKVFANAATFAEADKDFVSIADKGRAKALPRGHPLHTLRSALRVLMMRHRMAQQRGHPPRALLALPPKIEEDVEVKFSAAERSVYDSIHTAVRARYLRIKKRGELLQKSLVVNALLTPLRQACSGGASMAQFEEAGRNVLLRFVDLSAPDDDADTATGAGAAGAGASGKYPKISASAKLYGNDDCPICMELIETRTVTPCGHVFCQECITTVLSSGLSAARCPTCRNPCTLDSLRNAPLPVPAGGAGKTKEVEMNAKCKVLLAKLEEVGEDPSAKSLIFSHFQSTIEWLKGKLTAAGYNFRTLAGSMGLAERTKALRDFQVRRILVSCSVRVPYSYSQMPAVARNPLQNDPPTTVFLLSIRSGACGINLTQANNVFLMEPCINPALERQAIGRVHRMGQKRVVKVWRMVMRDSIEEKIIKVIKRATDGNVAGGESDDGGDGGGAGASGAGASASAGTPSPAKRARSDGSQPSQVGSIARDHVASLRLEELEILFSM